MSSVDSSLLSFCDSVVTKFVVVDSVADVVVDSLELSAVVVEGAAVVVVVVVVVVVDLNGLYGFGLSSVILISSGLVISLIVMPSGFPLASCMSSFGVLFPADAVAIDTITSFLVDFESESFAAEILTSSGNEGGGLRLLKSQIHLLAQKSRTFRILSIS